MKSLLFILVALVVVRRLSGGDGPQRTPEQQKAWAGYYGLHPELNNGDCVDEGMDYGWLRHLSLRRPNRGHAHG